jgi:hypothetical protein
VGDWFHSMRGVRDETSVISLFLSYLLPASLDFNQVFAGAPRSPSTSSFTIPPSGTSLLVHSLTSELYSIPPTFDLVFNFLGTDLDLVFSKAFGLTTTADISRRLRPIVLARLGVGEVQSEASGEEDPT